MKNQTSEQKCNTVIEWLQWYAENQYKPLLHDQRRCFSPDVILEAGMHGLMGLNVPEQYGGLDLDMRATVRVCQQLGSMDLSLATMLGNHNFLGIPPVMKHGSLALREEYLRWHKAGKWPALRCLRPAQVPTRWPLMEKPL